MRLLRPRVRGPRLGPGELRPIDELERSLDQLRLDAEASRELLDGVLASEDVIGAFADAQALARALASLPRRRPAVVARPMPRLAFATVVLASTMTVGTAFAQDLPAIAELVVARVVALVEGPAPLEAAVNAPVPDASWRETPASNPRPPEPVSPPKPTAPEPEAELEPPASAPAVEPRPISEPQPPPPQPKRTAQERVTADEPVAPVADRPGPPLLPDGGVVEELDWVAEALPVAESSTAPPDGSAEAEPPSLPEDAAETPVISDDQEEPVDEEPVDDDADKEKDNKEKEDHADEHAHEHADEHAAIHD